MLELDEDGAGDVAAPVTVPGQRPRGWPGCSPGATGGGRERMSTPQEIARAEGTMEMDMKLEAVALTAAEQIIRLPGR